VLGVFPRPLRETRLGQLVVAACAGAICLAAWGISSWIGDAGGILYDVGVAVRFIGFVGWWVILANVLGAIFGTTLEVEMAEGD
jgi:hypothetical protein